MISLFELWLPILLSAVAVFVASSIINMFLPYHRSDYGRIDDEERVLDGLRRANLKPGMYAFPHAATPKEMSSEAWLAKTKQGPVGYVTIHPSGPPPMAQSLLMWFVFSLFVSQLAAYIAGRTLGPGAPYMTVFQITSAVAFTGYAVALWEHAIWFSRAWSSTLKFTFDGLIYALLTGGIFGWLWP